jgi:hypothetical protein
MPKELFDVFAGHAFDGDHCFLCGISLDAANRTVEHVFPGWLQDAFNLRDHSITLLNRTRILYRNLVIPCCKDCNGTHLSQLENRIRAVILDHSKSLSEISDKDLNAWAAKIYLGILWKELELRYDRRTPDLGPILPKEEMENFRMMHFFMQACRKPMEFRGLNGRFPNSLLRIECKVPNVVEGQFDFVDSFTGHAVAIRMGEKAIVAIFDGGLHDLIFPNFADMLYENNRLHPIQFREVFANLAYKSSLSLRVPYYGIAQNVETDTYIVTLLAFDDRDKRASSLVIGSEDGVGIFPLVSDSVLESPAYGEWSQEDFARCLSLFTEVAVESLFVAPNLVRTSLRQNDGSFFDMPIENTSFRM